MSLQDRIAALEAERDRYRDALGEIEFWAEGGVPDYECAKSRAELAAIAKAALLPDTQDQP